MRVALLLFFLSLLALVGCKPHDVTPDDADTWHPDYDYDYDYDHHYPDEDLPPACKLDDTFFDGTTRTKMLPAEWTSFFTLKLSGLINDPAYEEPDFAFLTKIHATLRGVDYNLGDNYGMFVLDTITDSSGNEWPAVIATGVGTLTWPVSNKLASLWIGETFVPVDDLLSWKTQARTDGLTGIYVDGTYKVTIFEIWIEIAGSQQYTRMECMRGISALGETGPGYNGAMFFCVDTNTDWSIGEQMKMMSYAKMWDQDAEILAAINSGLTSEDPDYRTDVCRCYQRGVPATLEKLFWDNSAPLMDCEAMKAEFGIEDVPDDDTVSDDDAMTSDDDVLVVGCGNGILEAGEECEAGMSIPCVEIDPVQFSTGDAPCKEDCSGWDAAACIEQNSGNDDE